jgi:hypothetical protein
MVRFRTRISRRKCTNDTHPTISSTEPTVESLKGPAGERAWENRPGGIPNISKFLEMADIALGLKKPEASIKRRKAISAHDTSKTEPYSKV